MDNILLERGEPLPIVLTYIVKTRTSFWSALLIPVKSDIPNINCGSTNALRNGHVGVLTVFFLMSFYILKILTINEGQHWWRSTFKPNLVVFSMVKVSREKVAHEQNKTKKGNKIADRFAVQHRSFRIFWQEVDKTMKTEKVQFLGQTVNKERRFWNIGYVSVSWISRER